MKIFPIRVVEQGRSGQTSFRKFLSGVVTGVLAAAPALADQQMLPWRLHRQDAGVLRLSAEALTFGTDQNYGPSGDTVRVSGLDHLRRTEVAATAEYGIHPRLTLFGRATWNNTQVSSTTLNGNQYGWSDQSVGLSLRLLDSTLALDFQVQADLPAYKNAEAAAAGLPFLGDASTNVHVGGFATLPLGTHWRLMGGAGYTTRTANFSSSVPWSVELVKDPAFGRAGETGTVIRTLAWGFASLKDDPNASLGGASRPSGAAGSFLVNAINPSLAVSRVESGYRFNPEMALLAGYSYTLWGQAAARGSTWHLFLEWSLDRGKPQASYFKPEKKDEAFVTYSGQGKVKAVSSTRTLIIDQGSHQGMNLGDRVDVFTVTADGNLGEPVARGEVSQLDWDQSQITLLEVYRETAIKEGFAVQRAVQPKRKP